MKKKVLLLVLVLVFAICGASVYAVNHSEDTKDSKANLNGSVSGTAHYGASTHLYVVDGKVNITNKGNKKAKNVQLKLKLPKNVSGRGYTYQDDTHARDEEKGFLTVDLGTIKAGQTMTEKLNLYLDGKIDKSSDAITATIVSDNNHYKVDSKIDLAIMKEAYAEVSLDLMVYSEEQKGNDVLNVSAEGTNDSPYRITESDDVYLTFKLPDNVKVDQDKVKDKAIRVDNDLVGIRISAPGGEQFDLSATIPIKGNLTKKDCKHMDFYLSYLNDQGELIENGTIHYAIEEME